MPSDANQQGELAQPVTLDGIETTSAQLLFFAGAEQNIANLEAERRLLATQLEQTLGNSLNLLLAQASLYEQSLVANPMAHLAVSVLASLGRQSLQQLRDIIASLHPTILTDLGLEAALESLAAQLIRTRGIQLNLSLKRPTEKLPEQVALLIFRATQQVVDYLINQTQASLITISTSYSRTKLILQIDSNGLSVTQPTIFSSLTSRFKLFGGQLKIEKQQNGLTSIFFVVPVLTSVELTPRELEVLQQLAHGLSNKQIAQALQLSPRTVNFHLDNIYTKLEINSRTEAVVYALQYGWLRPTR